VAYRMLPLGLPMTLSNLGGHSLIASLFKWDLCTVNSCEAADKSLTDKARHAVPLL